MPLYTYVAIYKGSSYIAQQRRSNYQGFGDWIEALPHSKRKRPRTCTLGLNLFQIGRIFGEGLRRLTTANLSLSRSRLIADSQIEPLHFSNQATEVGTGQRRTAGRNRSGNTNISRPAVAGHPTPIGSPLRVNHDRIVQPVGWVEPFAKPIT
jgi:hypothetical protein